MKILSIETSGAVCGVALSVGDKVISEINSYAGQEHDRLLATFVQRLLSDASLNVEQLDAVAVSAGPGSFTGLRIGGATAKSLCFGGLPKLISVPTADALAFHCSKYAQKYSDILVSIKSHKDLVYFRKYDKFANPLSDIAFDSLDRLKESVGADTFFAGTGFEPLGIESHFANGIVANFIAEYAIELFKNGQFIDPSEFTPLYIQEFQPK